MFLPRVVLIYLLVVSLIGCEGFTVPGKLVSSIRSKSLSRYGSFRRNPSSGTATRSRRSWRSTSLKMGLDVVTFMRTEWVAAALCTNQTPKSADVCLQLGVEDGRAVDFIPKTVRELITSTAEKDGMLPVSTRRQLKQQSARRNAATVKYSDQPADDLRETADSSVDVVISLMAVNRMVENGLDWKKSIREAARVLKPGGRFLFVEQSEINGESYLEYIKSLIAVPDELRAAAAAAASADDDDGLDPFSSETAAASDDKNDISSSVEEVAVNTEDEDIDPLFDEVGYDDVDLVLVPHIAGVAIRCVNAGLTPEEIVRKESEAEEDRLADLAIAAYERGGRRRRRKRKKKEEETKEEKASTK